MGILPMRRTGVSPVQATAAAEEEEEEEDKTRAKMALGRMGKMPMPRG